jgi:hypothetical protein
VSSCLRRHPSEQRRSVGRPKDYTLSRYSTGVIPVARRNARKKFRAAREAREDANLVDSEMRRLEELPGLVQTQPPKVLCARDALLSLEEPPEVGGRETGCAPNLLQVDPLRRVLP